mgnify:CR=1 FL=1
MQIEIDFLRYQDKLTFRKEGRQRYIHDPIRRKYLVQTPEETVRQLTVLYLTEEKGYPKNRISIEKKLKINELTKRFDILIYEEAMQPFLLVECKAPAVPISQDTFRQIAIYNMPLNVRFLMVTNGLVTYCCEMNYELATYTFLEEVPAFPRKSSPEIS